MAYLPCDTCGTITNQQGSWSTPVRITCRPCYDKRERNYKFTLAYDTDAHIFYQKVIELFNNLNVKFTEKGEDTEIITISYEDNNCDDEDNNTLTIAYDDTAHDFHPLLLTIFNNLNIKFTESGEEVITFTYNL